MGRHAASAGRVGRARAARTALSRGLLFWTWFVTAAAFAGLVAALLLGPELQGSRGDDTVTPRQVVVGESTTAEPTPTGSSTSPSGSASPTASSTPTSPASSTPPVTSSSSPVTEPVSSPTTAGTSDPSASSPPAPSAASETSPGNPPPPTVAPFDPGPVLTSNASDDDRPTTATRRSKPASTPTSDATTSRERQTGDRVEPPAGDRRGTAPEVAVAGRKLAAAAGDGRAVGELRAFGSGLAQQDDRDDAARVGDSDTAAALSAPSPSASAGAGSVAPGTTGSEAAAPDGPDLHLHLDPTRTQVAVFLGVFLTGLATALAMTSTRSAGAHRRH